MKLGKLNWVECSTKAQRGGTFVEAGDVFTTLRRPVSNRGSLNYKIGVGMLARPAHMGQGIASAEVIDEYMNGTCNEHRSREAQYSKTSSTPTGLGNMNRQCQLKTRCLGPKELP
ncbi:hypothetical protein R1flu_001093 [Riccia fluitans]|uniref:Uncharacterized protein n=1 Tax=Riccia fluitans TaxID=41844 RepID=A0ABD1Y2B9_9MARC